MSVDRSFQASGSQLWVILLPQGTFGNFWLSQLGGAASIWRVEARDDAEYPTMPSKASTTKKYPAQNVSSAQAEKLCFKQLNSKAKWMRRNQIKEKLYQILPLKEYSKGVGGPSKE